MAQLYTRKRKDGSKIYCARIQALDAHFSTPSKKERDEWVAMMEYERRIVRAGLINRKVTLSQVLDEYELIILPEYRDKSSRKYTLDVWRSEFGKMIMSDIKRQHIENYLINRTDISGSTFGNYLGVLSKVCEFAITRMYLKDNPCRGIKRRKTASRTVWADQETVSKILEESKKLDYLYLHALLGFTTGIRPAEANAIEVKDISFQESLLHIPETKTGVARTIPMSQKLMDAISKYLKDNEIREGKIFLVKSIKKSWKTCVTKVGCPGFRRHDCRHTFATWLYCKTGDIMKVKEALGHRDIQSTIRYTHIPSEDVKASFKIIESILEDVA